MAKFDNKISTLVKSQSPEFVLADHPKFLEFVKTYFQFMEAAELKVSDIQATDGILLETETNQVNTLLLDGSRLATDRTPLDSGDKVLQETSTYGKFSFGEVITGQTSKATATVLAEDLTTNSRLFISSQDKFKEGEIITGNSSGASATISSYRPNPVNNIQELVNFRDPDKVISGFLGKFREEFLKTIPENLDGDVDKRKLIKNIRSMYRVKGTAKGHELFFRLLFNEQAETLYPKENMLRASDGNFNTKKIMRTIDPTGETTDLIGKSISGATSLATASVENVFKFQIGDKTVSEFILNDDSITGSFQVGEIIQGQKETTDDVFIKSTITGILSGETITNNGTLYSDAQNVAVSGGGKDALIQVSGIGSGGIDQIILDNRGTNYAVGDTLTFNNANTNGGNASGFVSVVNGGFNLEDGVTDQAETENHILLEEGTTGADVYPGQKVVQEAATTNTGEITDVFLTNEGTNYTSLPILSVTSGTGSGAKLKTYGSKIGKVENIKLIEAGIQHEVAPTPPTVKFNAHLILTDVEGTFVLNETVSGVAVDSSVITGKVTGWDADRGLLSLKETTGNFAVGENCTAGTSGATGKLAVYDQATSTFSVVATSTTDGEFLNEDGFLSETTMKIQDSLYYQDYSYVLKVGSSINVWRDAFKSTMHTAGFYYAGQVNIANRVNARIRFPVKGIESGSVESPFLQVLNTLFSTVLGRRLGTVDDGTTLRVKPWEAGKPDFDTSTLTPFANTTRDITLKRNPILIDYTSRPRIQITGGDGSIHTIKSGWAYAGPRFGTINREALSSFSGSGTNYSFAELSKAHIMGTRTVLDGTPGSLLMTSNFEGRKLKTNLTIPATIGTSADLFSNTLTKFDSNSISFDDTTA